MGTLAFVVWRVTGEMRVERQQMNSFMHGVIDRIGEDSVMEVAKADVMREAAQQADEQQAGEYLVSKEKIAEHTRQGYNDPEEAMARALMESVGLNPDDNDDVQLWNSRAAGRQH